MTEKELQVILEEGEGYRSDFKEALSGLDKYPRRECRGSAWTTTQALQWWDKLATHDFSRGTKTHNPRLQS